MLDEPTPLWQRPWTAAVIALALAGCSRGPLAELPEPPADVPTAQPPRAQPPQAQPPDAAAGGAGGGSAVAQRCTSAQYLHTTAAGASRCAELTVCGQDEYERSPATPTADRRCAALTDCSAGQYVVGRPTATADRVCAACPPGTFSDRINAAECAAWTECPDVGWAIEGSATADRSCECLAGSAGVVQGDVLAQSQAEVDALAGVREITGYLRVAGVAWTLGGPVVADTSSLAALACLQRIGNALQVNDHRSLSTLTGLERLASVGALEIARNQVLSSLDALAALTFANGVGVRDNAALLSLVGLAGLTVLRDHMAVELNDALTDLAGLHNLESVGRLVINGNQSLTSLSALSSLTTVRGSLEIGGTQLTSLTGLEGIDAVGARLVIFSNSSLTSLEGLDNVARIGSALVIGYNAVLSSLDGLDAVTSIGEAVMSSENRLSIYVNPELTSIAGLRNLQTLVGPLLIYGNSRLSRCQAEALASQLGVTCTSSSDPWTCTDVCTCGGNLNDVVCTD